MKKYSGAFFISRTIFEHGIFVRKPPCWFKIWIFIIGHVNYEDTKLLKRGEGIFSYKKIMCDCGSTKAQTENAIQHFKKQLQIKTQKTTRGFIIKVLNYDHYQDINTYKSDRKRATQRAKDRGIGADTKEPKQATLYKKNKKTKINNKINNTNIAYSEKSSILQEPDKVKVKNYSQSALKLAYLFYSFAGQRYLDLCPNYTDKPDKLLETWAEEIEKLKHIDSLDYTQIKFLITWLFSSDSKNASFWKNQIIAPQKFRQKNKDGVRYWRVLVDQMRQESDNHTLEEQTYSL